MKTINFYNLTTALSLTVILAYIQNLSAPFIILGCLMICDYITGLLKSWKNKNLSSKTGIEGILKKVCYLAFIIVGIGLDCTLYTLGSKNDLTPYFGLFITVWLSINEMISILENITELGVPVPNLIKKIASKLKSKLNTEDNSNE